VTRRPDGEASSREAGLRWLAQSTATAELDLQHVLQQPGDPSKSVRQMQAMRALVAGMQTSMPLSTTSEQRARALWRLIQDEIDRIGLPHGQRRRAALRAALHLDPDNDAPTIDQRLIYARDAGQFGQKASGRQHGYDALRMWWGWGVRMLGIAIDERLDFLSDYPVEWQAYVDEISHGLDSFRTPSRQAQQVFMDFFLTTVFMKGRSVYRRITERLLTAQVDGLEHYVVRGFNVGDTLRRVYVPVRPLWGCQISLNPVSQPTGGRSSTRLRFPRSLRRGGSSSLRVGGCPW
jgi:hypothetical protein